MRSRLCSSLSLLLPSSSFSRAPLPSGVGEWGRGGGSLMKHYRRVMPDVFSELGSFSNGTRDGGGWNCKRAGRHFVWFPSDSLGRTQEGFASAADLHLLLYAFHPFSGLTPFFLSPPLHQIPSSLMFKIIIFFFFCSVSWRWTGGRGGAEREEVSAPAFKWMDGSGTQCVQNGCLDNWPSLLIE